MAAVLTLCIASASPAFAQRADGPFSGLLGANPSADRVHGLDLNASMFGSYNRNVFPPSDAAQTLDERLKQDGAAGGASASLAYDAKGDRARFGLGVGGSAFQYQAMPDELVVNYNATTSLQTQLGSRNALNVSGGAAYSPFFGFAPFLDASSLLNNVGPLAPGPGFATVAARNVAFDGLLAFTSNLSKRTTLSVAGTVRETVMLDGDADDLQTIGAHASIAHKLTRNLGLHAGYGRDHVRYGFTGPESFDNDSIDAGVDYGDTLSFARRTALIFSTSTSAIKYRQETHYRLNGSALLTRGFRRSWSTWFGYLRATEFRAGFRAPLLTDSVNTGVSGLVALRAKWSAAGGYSRGAIGFDSSRFTSYSGTSRVDLALARKLGLFAQYAYFHYDMPPGASQLAIVPRFSRQTATFGLSLWVPIVNDVKAPKGTQQP
jgi:hypothetical protein